MVLDNDDRTRLCYLAALSEVDGMTISEQSRESAAPGPVIDVRGISKWFGNLVAVNEVS